MNFGGNILLALITSFRVYGMWRTMLLLLLLRWLQWIHLRFVENGNWSNFPLIIRILLFIYAIVIAVANELSLKREKKTNSWYNSFHFVSVFITCFRCEAITKACFHRWIAVARTFVNFRTVGRSRVYFILFSPVNVWCNQLLVVFGHKNVLLSGLWSLKEKPPQTSNSIKKKTTQWMGQRQTHAVNRRTKQKLLQTILMFPSAQYKFFAGSLLHSSSKTHTKMKEKMFRNATRRTW